MDATSNVEEGGASTWLCDYIVEQQLRHLRPDDLVDFGAGAGKNGRLARRALGTDCKTIAVEGFERTAATLKERGIYDRVDTALLQQWVDNDEGKYSCALFGDVIEHLTPRQIHYVLRKCLDKFAHVIIVVPLYDIFQDDAYGNELEIHRSYITSGFFDRYKPVEKHVVKGGEFSIMNLLITTHPQLPPLYRRFLWRVFHVTMLVLQPLGLARPLVDLMKRFGRKYSWLIR
jgi:hypothetical protein